MVLMIPLAIASFLFVTFGYCSEFLENEFSLYTMTNVLSLVLPADLVILTRSYGLLTPEELIPYYENVEKILRSLSGAFSLHPLKLSDFQDDNFMIDIYKILNSHRGSLMVRNNFYYQLFRVIMKWRLFKGDQYSDNPRRLKEITDHCNLVAAKVRSRLPKTLQTFQSSIFLNTDFSQDSSLFKLIKIELVECWKVIFPIFKARSIKTHFSIDDPILKLNPPLKFEYLLTLMFSFFDPLLKKIHSSSLKTIDPLSSFKSDLDKIQIQFNYSEHIDDGLFERIMKGGHLIYIYSDNDFKDLLLKMYRLRHLTSRQLKKSLSIRYNFDKDHFLESLKGNNPETLRFIKDAIALI